MRFVVLFGPPAVGKMTVGYELAKLTGFRLFHNHMTIDLVLNFFDFGTPPFTRLVNEFRTRVFEEVAASGLPGLIFTYVWALDHPGDKEFVDNACDIFRSHRRRGILCRAGGQTWTSGCGATRRSSAWPRSARSVIFEHSRRNLLEAERMCELNSDETISLPSTATFTSTTPMSSPTSSPRQIAGVVGKVV